MRSPGRTSSALQERSIVATCPRFGQRQCAEDAAPGRAAVYHFGGLHGRMHCHLRGVPACSGARQTDQVMDWHELTTMFLLILIGSKGQ